jgi:hypothetical protein
MIKSEISKQFLLEEDAVEGFRTAVANGQVRLALQIMTEIVDGIMEIFDAALGDDDDETPGEDADGRTESSENKTDATTAVVASEDTAKEASTVKEKKESNKKAQDEKTESTTVAE